ncbi:hypothetical protein B296_00034710 [Ensete ventricosum]|uniref:Uncharacterized protein n=1 Tax=Ensete ventricosum TaxID=4639 RepID=A0A426YKB6_ENSVE|nr:hypothetical protein B296_00034710 [Ensete ventricosum]
MDINLIAEFKITNPTTDYMMLLHVLPTVFVDNRDLFERVVKLMWATTKSMKGTGMHVPSWRQREYVRAKWFNSYGKIYADMPIEKGVAWVARKITNRKVDVERKEITREKVGNGVQQL